MRSLLGLASVGLAAAANWTIIAPNVGTISTGISFDNAQRGFLPADSNGVGAQVLISQDGGYTWNYTAPGPGGLLFLDVASYGNTAVVAGVLEMLYSLDATSGASFNLSLGGGGSAQCVRPIGPKGSEIGYAAVGDFGLLVQTNGIAVSFDSGVTFSAIAANLSCDARYGAFPTDSHWVVSAGDWPNGGGGSSSSSGSGSEEEGALVDPSAYATVVAPGSTFVRRISNRLHVLREPTGEVVRAWAHKSTDNSTWMAAIAVTEDAGKSWTETVNVDGQYYFNGIESINATNTCVVAEEDGVATGGSYIYCSTDGGYTWSLTHNNKDPNSSLLDISWAGPNELWAVGGEFGSGFPAAAHFWHSLDGGASWSLDSTIVGNYAAAIDCVPGVGCWANLLNAFQQSSVAFWPAA